MKQKSKYLGVISLALLPFAANAQIYQDASNSTATVVRDPARQASTEVDAAIFNPAGTAFLEDGLHFSLNSKLAYKNYNESSLNNDEKHQMLDEMPSLQAAYKNGSWALSLSLGNEGGFGAFHASEIPWLSNMLTDANNIVFDSYKTSMSEFTNNCNIYDKLVSNAKVSGSLYNYSARVGAAYKITPKLSVSAGLRFNYVTEQTYLGINRWVSQANTQQTTANAYFTTVDNGFRRTMQDYMQPYQDIIDLANSMGIDASNLQETVDMLALLTDFVSEENQKMANTPNFTSLINTRTNGWGIAPVIGMDYNVDKFNFAVKYEFETKIHTEDGVLSYHIPSVLSLGASWQPKDNLKISLGGTLYHQSGNSLYGRKQMIDLSEQDLWFNMAPAQGSNASYQIIKKGGLTSGDISASISFSPIEHLMFSVGYTYASQAPLYRNAYLQSCSTATNLGADIVSGGLRYDINDNIQLDFGVSKKTLVGRINTLSYTLSDYNGLNMSAGINIHF